MDSMKYLAAGLTLQYDPTQCRGCGRCVEVCPQGVFELHQENQQPLAVIVRKEWCMECGACVKNCETQAIQVKTGVGCATALFYSLRTGKPPCC